MSKQNEPLPVIANSINADLIPAVRKWLGKHHPDAKYTDSHLSTLMVYALSPDDFKMPNASDAVRAFHGKHLETLSDVLELLPDAGFNQIHALMTRDPVATIAVMAQFQHEDSKLIQNKIKRCLRRENCEGMSGNELVEYLVDTGKIKESDKASARRRLNELRAADMQNLEGSELKYYRAKF